MSQKPADSCTRANAFPDFDLINPEVEHQIDSTYFETALVNPPHRKGNRQNTPLCNGLENSYLQKLVAGVMNNRDTFLRKYAHSYDSLPVQKKFWLITKQLSS